MQEERQGNQKAQRAKQIAYDAVKQRGFPRHQQQIKAPKSGVNRITLSRWGEECAFNCLSAQTAHEHLHVMAVIAEQNRQTQ